MLTLLHFLENAKSTDEFLVLSGGSHTYAQCLKLTIELASTLRLKGAEGKRIALKGLSNTELALLLPGIESVASALFLAPENLKTEELNKLYTEACIDLAVSLENGSPVLDWIKPNLKQIRTEVGCSWIIPTSGTTSTPKCVVHTLQSLIKSCKSKNPNNKTIVWGLLYSISRFAGLQVYLQALLSGSSLCVANDLSDLHSTFAFFSRSKVNALSATPSMWRKALMHKEALQLKPVSITLGGEIADQGILNALAKFYPTCKIRHIYASTELGFGFSVSDGLAGFPKSFINNKDLGVILKVTDDGQLMARVDLRGELICNDPTNDDGFFPTGDEVEVIEERVFFKGRINGAINIGGNKIQPEFIEGVILEVEGVEMAQVSPRKNSITGYLLQATIVPKAGSDSAEVLHQVKNHCRKNLKPFQAPSIYIIADNLSLTSNGKIERRANEI